NSTTIDVYVVPDSSMGDSVPGTAYRYARHSSLPRLENSLLVDERAVNGLDATRPFTFGHELGHILFNGLYPDSDPNGHDTDPQNLMLGCNPFTGVCGTSNTERWGATKRLRQAQVEDVRSDSGPGNNDNP